MRSHHPTICTEPQLRSIRWLNKTLTSNMSWC